MTLQSYGDETGDILHKLCIYSVNKGFVCDINMDFPLVSDFYLMDDGNIITYTKKEKTKIFKIGKKDVKEIWVSEQKALTLKKLSNNIIFINTITSGESSKSKSKMKTQEELYNYDKDKLIINKNIAKLYKDEGIENICYIHDNEYAFYTKKKGKIFGTNYYIIFYDMQINKKIKELKIKRGDITYTFDMVLNKDTLIVDGKDDKIVLIDTKIRKIKKEINLSLVISHIFLLNEKTFLYNAKKLEQYEFKNSTIEYKESDKKIMTNLLSKYPGNKIIIYKHKKISIYG